MKHFLALITFMLIGTILVPISIAERTQTKQQITFEELFPGRDALFNIKGESNAFNDDFFYKQLIKESYNRHLLEDGSLIKSKAGALGIAQFMPKTWNWLKKKSILPEYFDIKNLDHQKMAQKIYMNYLYAYNYGTTELCQRELAIAAYNCGPGRVSREVRKHKQNWKKYIPKETINYLKKLS